MHGKRLYARPHLSGEMVRVAGGGADETRAQYIHGSVYGRERLYNGVR